MTSRLAEIAAARRAEITGTGGPPPPMTIYEWLRDQDAQKRDLADAALPIEVTNDHIVRMAIAAVRASPGLAAATADSVLGAVIQSLQLGLEPGPLEHVWIHPKTLLNQSNLEVATFMLGYKGILELALRSPDVLSVDVQVVYDDELDGFAIEQGTEPGIWHRPRFDVEPGTNRTPRCYYGVVHYAGGGRWQKLMTLADIEEARQDSGDPDGFFWFYRPRQMALKTVIRAMQNWLRLSPTVGAGWALDGQTISAAAMSDDAAGFDIPDDDGPEEPAPDDPEPET